MDKESKKTRQELYELAKDVRILCTAYRIEIREETDPVASLPFVKSLLKKARRLIGGIEGR